jgi:hypothetical protein
MDFHMHLLIASSPQSASNAVLAMGFHFQKPLTLAHRLLDTFFQNARFQTKTILYTGNPI